MNHWIASRLGAGWLVFLAAMPLSAQTPEAGPPAVLKQPPVFQTGESTLVKTSISAAGAQRMIDAVTAAAEKDHNAVTVVVVDEGGGLIALKRMDGANLGSLQAATLKAATALKLGLPSGTFIEDGPPNIPIATAFISAGFTLLAGGEPVKLRGNVIGAIAVSGTGNEKAYIRAALLAAGL